MVVDGSGVAWGSNLGLHGHVLDMGGVHHTLCTSPIYVTGSGKRAHFAQMINL